MEANGMLKYGDKIIEAFRDGTFLSEHLKKSDNVAYDYMLKEVSKFVKKIKSMAKNINLSLFNEFFESSPVNYAKYLINFKNTEKKQRICNWGKKQNISFKRQNKKNERKRKKKKSADETLKVIEEILDYNKNAQRFFPLASKVDKRKSEPTPKESIAERVKLRRQRSAEIAKKEKKISLELFGRYFGRSSPSDMYKALNEIKKPRRKQSRSKYNRKQTD